MFLPSKNYQICSEMMGIPRWPVGVAQRWCKTPRWPYASSMAERWMPHLGCHGGRFSSNIKLFIYLITFRFDCRTSSCLEKIDYTAIMLTHIFVSVAVETLGPVNAKGLPSLDQIGDRLSANTRAQKSHSFHIKGYPSCTIFQCDRFSSSFTSEMDIEV